MVGRTCSAKRRLIGVYRNTNKLHSQRGKMNKYDYDMSVIKLENRLARLGTEDWHHPTLCVWQNDSPNTATRR